MKTSEVEIRNKHTYGTRTVTVLTSSYTICLFVATDIIQKKKRKRKKKEYTGERPFEQSWNNVIIYKSRQKRSNAE